MKFKIENFHTLWYFLLANKITNQRKCIFADAATHFYLLVCRYFFLHLVKSLNLLHLISLFFFFTDKGTKSFWRHFGDFQTTVPMPLIMTSRRLTDSQCLKVTKMSHFHFSKIKIIGFSHCFLARKFRLSILSGANLNMNT